MITAQEATKIVLDNLMSLETESIPFAEAVGRILAEDLMADNDFPPFDRVMRDGIAFQYDDFENGVRRFKIQGLQAAGSPPLTVEGAENCVEIMTGAVLTKGTDAVVMYEETTIEDGFATINLDAVKHFQNIHPQGSDKAKGTLLVSKGAWISPAELGVAASIGKTHLTVFKIPKVAIVSTGDELVPVEEQPLPYQIRRSNVFTLEPLLKDYRIEPTLFHLLDNREAVTESIRQLIKDFDVVCLSGGVSKGKLDFVPDALEACGVQKLFYKVKQRPGKPFWFGKAPNGTTIFALPGNPVSSFMCTNRYLIPWLRASLGLTAFRLPYAELTEDFSFKKDLQYFLQVKTSFGTDGKLYATPEVGNGSGDLVNLVDADGFLELPSEKNKFKKGECYRFISYR
jgi:molybdopterin molybdotransferase